MIEYRFERHEGFPRREYRTATWWRTLQRWLDDLNIESLEFEDHLKVFLTLPQVKLLREYSKFMDTRNHSLIERFREYNSSGNTRRMAQLKRELKEYLTE